MERRTFVSVSAALTTGLAGCSSGLLSNPESEFELANIEYKSSVEHDETFSVTVEVENVGEADGGVDLVLEIDNGYVTDSHVETDPDELAGTLWEVDAAKFEPGERQLSVLGSGDITFHEGAFTIQEPDPPEFLVEDLSAPSSVRHDEMFEIEVDISNAGEQSDSVEPNLSIGVESDSGYLWQIKPQESQTATFAIDASELDPGEQPLTVSTPDDRLETTLEIGYPNPWGTETVQVASKQNTEMSLDPDDVVREALDYWEQNVTRYTDHELSYQYRPDANHADIVITFTDSIDRCGNNSGDNIAGCAPVIQDQAPLEADVRIVPYETRKWTVQTIIHEVGHTLGLTHDDEPARYMSDDPEDRLPDYEERDQISSLHSDSYNDRVKASDSYSVGIGHLNENQFAQSRAALRDAIDQYSNAESRLDRAQEIADRIGEDHVWRLIYESKTHVEYKLLATEEAQELVDAKENGNYDDFNRHRDDVIQHNDRADNHEFASSIDVLEALGFIRL